MRNVRPESGRSGAPNHDCADTVVGGPQGSRKLRPIRYLFSFCALSLGPSLCPYVCPSGCPCVHPHSMPSGDPQSRQYGPLVLGARNSRVTLGQKMAVWGRNHESATQSLGSRNFQGSFARTTFHVVFARRPLRLPSCRFCQKTPVCVNRCIHYNAVFRSPREFGGRRFSREFP